MTASIQLPSLKAFLAALEVDRREREREEEVDALLEGMARRPKHRDVVEVDCSVAEIWPADNNGVKHILLAVALTDVIESDAEVDSDVQSHLESHQHVLVVIQVGSRDGIPDPIPGLTEGVDIRVRGVWIPAEQAHPVGNEKLSVLHFAHAPVGFVMVGDTIYR